MRNTIPIGTAFGLLSEKFGQAGAASILRKRLHSLQLEATADEFQAVCEAYAYKWPTSGHDRTIPPDFWWHDWPLSGERTTGERSYSTIMQADWQNGRFSLTDNIGGIRPTQNVIIAEGVTVDGDGLAKLCEGLGIALGKVTETDTPTGQPSPQHNRRPLKPLDEANYQRFWDGLTPEEKGLSQNQHVKLFKEAFPNNRIIRGKVRAFTAGRARGQRKKGSA